MGPRAGLDGGKSRPIGIRSPDRPARSQLLYRLSYPAHLRLSYTSYVSTSPVWNITAEVTVFGGENEMEQKEFGIIDTNFRVVKMANYGPWKLDYATNN